MKMGRGFVGVVNPHRHVDHIDFPQPTIDDPFFRQPGGRREAMIEVDSIAQVFLAGESDHCFGFGDFVGDGFFAQHRAAGGKQLHGRLIVVAAVFGAGGGDAGDVKLDAAFQHRLHRIKPLTAISLGRLVRFFGDDVADGDDFGIGMFGINARMGVADAAHANNRCSKCHYASSL